MSRLISRSPLALAASIIASIVASIVASIAACATAPPPVASTDPAAQGNLDGVLRAQTQAMLDAVAAGDTKVWDRYLDPQMMYLSEAGEVYSKAQLLDELKPLPAGITGHIAISRFEVRPFGNTAVVLHVDEETENYFGHEIHAQYMNTATWRRGTAGWTLIAQQVLATQADPPAIALPAAQLDEYAGSYQLSDAIHYAIRREADHLVGERTGRPPQALRIEARDVVFVPGQPRSRKVFQRDAGGRIIGFADRREGRDIVWTRQ